MKSSDDGMYKMWRMHCKKCGREETFSRVVWDMEKNDAADQARRNGWSRSKEGWLCPYCRPIPASARKQILARMEQDKFLTFPQLQQFFPRLAGQQITGVLLDAEKQGLVEGSVGGWRWTGGSIEYVFGRRKPGQPANYTRWKDSRGNGLLILQQEDWHPQPEDQSVKSYLSMKAYKGPGDWKQDGEYQSPGNSLFD